MSIMQSDYAYAVAEYDRRLAEYDLARREEEGAWAALKQADAYHDMVCDDMDAAGVEWPTAKAVRAVSWERRMAAARDWRYAMSIVQARSFAKRAAFQRAYPPSPVV